MAIESFDRLWKQSRLVENDAGVVNWERYFRAISDSPGLDDESTVRGDSRCPVIGSPVNATRTDITARQIEVTPQDTSRIEYLVRVTYSNDVEDGGGQADGNPPDLPESPFDDPPSFSADDNLQFVPFERDLDGKLATNTAGDLFDPLPQRFTQNLVITATRFEEFFSVEKLRQYSNKVNSSPFLGEAKGRWLCRVNAVSRFIDREYTANIGGKDVKRTRRWFGWNYTYRFEFNENGWQPQQLNKGFNQIANGEKKRIKINGEDASNPQLLSKNGVYIPSDNPLDALSSALFINFRTYDEVDFNQLNLTLPGN
jgi:hypothetical protein